MDNESERTICSIGRRASAARMGVGNSMMRKIVKELRKRRKFSGTVLQVRASNKGAIRLYKSFGFKKIWILKNYFEYPIENGYLMEVPINKDERPSKRRGRHRKL